MNHTGEFKFYFSYYKIDIYKQLQHLKYAKSVIDHISQQ